MYSLNILSNYYYHVLSKTSTNQQQYSLATCPREYRRVYMGHHESRGDTQMTRTTETRKLRNDLTPEQKAQAEKIGSLPTGQRIKTAWGMRVEKFIPSRAQH